MNFLILILKKKYASYKIKLKLDMEYVLPNLVSMIQYVIFLINKMFK